MYPLSLSTTYTLLSNNCICLSAMSTVQVLAPAKERAMNLLGAIDLDGDGGISKEEFLTIGVKLFNYGEEDNEEQ